jgi:hypothetical protein
MGLFLILAPFGAFNLLMMVAPTAVSLFGAATLAFGIVGYDILRGGSVKLLATGSVLLFGALGGYITLIDGSFGAAAVRLAVDSGVLALALLSLAIRLPFTLQYARERIDPEIVKLPHFVRVNYILTWAWTGAFLLMLVADMLAVYIPSLPLWLGMAIAFAARNSAVYFTRWYPKYRRSKQGTAAASRDA